MKFFQEKTFRKNKNYNLCAIKLFNRAITKKSNQPHLKNKLDKNRLKTLLFPSFGVPQSTCCL
jgi:hypothetical protein